MRDRRQDSCFNRGIRHPVDLVPESFNAEGLIEAFLKNGSTFNVQSSEKDIEPGTSNFETF